MWECCGDVEMMEGWKVFMGKVYLVGVGLGDSDLIILKGLKVI